MWRRAIGARGHDPERRRFLGKLVRLGGVAAMAVGLAGRHGAAAASAEAARPEFMERAFAMRRAAEASGDQPYGAVVVKEGRIVGEAPSRVVVARDPTAHAEMEAIRDACRRLGTRDLGGCDLYATSRPCRMCEVAAYWAHVSRTFSGADMTAAGPPRYPAC